MMSQAATLEAGSRHDLRVGLSPDAPDEADFRDDSGVFGYAHSYESSSRYDGPGLRMVLFLSGCLLRCTYCHNPDTWHLKDGPASRSNRFSIGCKALRRRCVRSMAG
jgi:pyruvate formate lyase activating enzyme